MILPVSRKLSTNSNRNIKTTLGLRRNPKKLYLTIPNTCLMSVTQIPVYDTAIHGINGKEAFIRIFTGI